MSDLMDDHELELAIFRAINSWYVDPGKRELIAREIMSNEEVQAVLRKRDVKNQNIGYGP